MLIINTLIPIFCLIILGYFFKKIQFPDESFWKHLDKFNYFVLFPSLLFYKLTTADIKNILTFDFILIGLVAIATTSVFLIILNKFMRVENSSFTSIYQGAIRFNVYVFIALSSTLLSNESFVMGMLLMAFVTPFINILCISIFSLYIPKNKISIVSFLKSIMKNPLIVSCVLGVSINISGFSIPTILENALSIVSSASLPMGLLSIGVGLHLSALKDTKMLLFISSFAKLILLPIIVYILCLLFEINKDITMLMILFAAMPTGSASYVLARQLGGDLKLISSIISIQVILSIFTISLVLWIFGI